MDTRQARYLIALAEELNFTRAAKRCNISQPPLSRAISRLEREVGAQLFVRDTHRVALTAAGQNLVKDARRALELLEKGAAAARRIAQGLEGTLTLGFGGSMAYAVLPAAVKHFRRRAPHVELKFLAMPVGAQIDAIREGIVDVGVVLLPVYDELIATQTIIEDPVGLVAPDNHPTVRSRNKVATISDLAESSFIVYTPMRGFNFHANLFALCRIAGFEPRIVHEAATTEALVGIVASGEGVATVPASVQSLRTHGVTYVPLNTGKAPKNLTTWHFAFAWHKERATPVAIEFLRRAKEIDFSLFTKSFIRRA
jgi:DNA-binding transcriptional LysR family regulator